MPLSSRQFKGDRRFEDCLVRPAAHVVPGERGTHVAKIQEALTKLGAGVISADEITHNFYGPTTKRAVLGFKTARKIINPAYQAKPDDIVGQMTIAALDREMFDLENRPTPDPVQTSLFVSMSDDGAQHVHTNCPGRPRVTSPGRDNRAQHRGTPINPQGGGMLINIGGEGETDYLAFQDFRTDGPPQNNIMIFGDLSRPLTQQRPQRERSLHEGHPHHPCKDE